MLVSSALDKLAPKEDAMQVTAEQIKALWTAGHGSIDRGDDYSPITLEDFEGFDIDTDESGWPTDEMWQVMADQFNSETPGSVAPSLQQDQLDAIRDAVQRIAEAETERDDQIRAAINNRVPVTAIAEAADLGRSRIYQIRDGVRR